jgi:lycopene cyclase domain-containing protein
MGCWWEPLLSFWGKGIVNIVEYLPHLTYLFMEVYIIGAVAFVLWIFHLRFLWRRRWWILLGTAIVTVYALPMDAAAIALHWGGFYPQYVTGITFFGGSLALEEIIFWLGTSFVTVSAVMIFAELERKGTPWWLLPVSIILPVPVVEDLIKQMGLHQRQHE